MMIELLTAVKSRWNQKNLGDLITGGIFRGTPPTRTPRPYSYIPDNLPVLPKAKTNFGRYHDLRFVIITVADTFEELQPMVNAIDDAFMSAPLVLEQGRLVTLDDGGVNYLEEAGYHRVSQEFQGTVGRAANWNPA